MKILYCTGEAAPYAKSGGLGDVAGALPKAINKAGHDCRVMLPLYKTLKFRDELKYLTSFYVSLSWRNQYCGLFAAERDGVTFYFIDNEYYFGRDAFYGSQDDAERFAFFSKACLEAILHLDFQPDILNCNDWQTALIPVFLNVFYRQNAKYANLKTVFTIHNIQYQGKYGQSVISDICGLSDEDALLIEYDGCANFMKGAIETADMVTTVSPTYAKEILDPWFSFGLDGFLKQKQYKLRGILNGIDLDTNNPETDPHIAANFSADNLSGKQICKKALIQRFSLQDDGSPVYALVTRLVEPKGVDLVKYIAERLISDGVQLVILGTGDKAYEEYFWNLNALHPGRVGSYIGFDTVLAQQIYAGADVFVMPSKSEPCGLAQMVSCRYGTIPIIRETGGLKDSIEDAGTGKGNGFTFCDYNGDMLYDACRRALDYYHSGQWNTLVQRSMHSDFSWDVSAQKYLDMYQETLSKW